MRVKKAVDQVQVSWAATPGTGCELATQLGLRACGERGCFLVPDMDPLQLAVSAHCVGNRVQAVAYDAIHPLDPGFHEPADQFICHTVGHSFPPFAWAKSNCSSADISYPEEEVLVVRGATLR